MTGGRSTIWRQGNLLREETASSLQLQVEIDNASIVWLIASHDCDLANLDKEPLIEIIPGKILTKLGQNLYGKNPRSLHLELDGEDQPLKLELDVTRKTSIEKIAVYGHTPCPRYNLSGDKLIILQRWLAARYYRAAFPDNFVNLLSSKTFLNKKDTLPKRIEALLDNENSKIRSLLFDLDNGDLVERQSGDIYNLGIFVLYDSNSPGNTAFDEARKAANEIEQLFLTAFYADNKWEHIEIEYCEPISDQVMTVAQQQNLKQWRLEHISLNENPIGLMLAPQ